MMRHCRPWAVTPGRRQPSFRSHSRSLFCCRRKAAYEVRIRDWSSDVCSSDLEGDLEALEVHARVFSGADLAGRAAAGPPMPEDVPSIEVADDGLLIWRDGAYALGARTIEARGIAPAAADRKSTRLNSSH